VELIVSKLPRNGILAATTHLQALLGEFIVQHPSEPLVPVRIVAGDERVETRVSRNNGSMDPGLGSPNGRSAWTVGM
jgi:hypothetical protein